MRRPFHKYLQTAGGYLPAPAPPVALPIEALPDPAPPVALPIADLPDPAPPVALPIVDWLFILSVLCFPLSALLLSTAVNRMKAAAITAVILQILFMTIPFLSGAAVQSHIRIHDKLKTIVG